MIDPSCDTSAEIARAHLFTWQTTVAVRYTAFSLGTDHRRSSRPRAIQRTKDAATQEPERMISRLSVFPTV